MNTFRSVTVAMLLLASSLLLPTVPASCSPREDAVPVWGPGTYWTYAADSEIVYNISQGGNSLNLTHVSGTDTDSVSESTVFMGIPVYRVEGSYSLTIKGNATYMGMPMPVTWAATGNTSEYYRISDLATVYAMEHFSINMGIIGTTVFDSNQTPVPPLINYGFPLAVPDAWHVDTNITVWQRTTGPMGNSESTNVTRDVFDAAILKQDSITVPAGSFTCYNVSELGTTSTDGGPPQPYNNTRLYSPKATTVVVKLWSMMENLTVIFQLSDYALNRPPVVTQPLPVVSFPEDTVYTGLNLNIVFSDPDVGDSLTLYAYNFSKVMVVPDNATGAVTITPTKDWSGTEKVLFKATDKRGAAAFAELNITVTPVNDQPALARVLPDIVMDEDAVDGSLNLSNYFTDPDLPYGDVLSFSFRSNGSVAVSIAANGTVTLAPFRDWSGAQNATFVAKDKASIENSDTLEVTVRPMPDSPVVVASTHSLAVDEDTVLNVSLAQRFSDPDLPYGDVLAYSTSGFPPAFTLKLDAATGVLELTPPKDFNGAANGTFTATDKTNRAVSENVTVTVKPVNDPPEVVSVNPAANITIAENSTRLFSVNATDIDTSTLEVTWYLDGVRTSSGKEFTFAPDFSAAGGHTILASVSDGQYTVNRSWTVTITNVNRRPEAVRILSPLNGSKLQEGKGVLLQGSASDPDGDAITYRWKDTSGKLLEVGQNVTTKLLTKGKHLLTLEVSDGNDTASVTITVIINPKPSTNQPGFEGLMLAAAIVLGLVLVRRRRESRSGKLDQGSKAMRP